MPDPPIRIEIETNAPVAARDLFRFRRQLPFAMAASLTDTAKDARDFVRTHLGESFTVRSHRVRTSIVHAPADKVRQESRVSIRDQWLARHVRGEWSQSERGHRFAIPTRVIERRRTSTGKIPKAQRPRRVRQRKTVFTQEGKIQQRRTTRRDRRRILYLLRRRVRIRSTFPFEQQVRREATRVWRAHFARRFQQAVRTRRR